MDIALCYESVLPSRGGAETYISDLARRLAKDGHSIHLYACRWDATALPSTIHFHGLEISSGPRFLRPWRFATACENALRNQQHDVSIGFDKTWGQDILYPQGGLHAASRHHNLLKYQSSISRFAAAVGKYVDPAASSFARLERKQYLGSKQLIIVVNSRMVQRHFAQFYGIGPERVRVIHSAIDPLRFASDDRLMLRKTERDRWGLPSNLPVGLMVAMNYRLKGLAQLIRGVAAMPAGHEFRIAVVGHPKYERYRKLAQRLGVDDHFLFLGFRADPKEAYFAADFLVHPTFYDPCSLVVLEALACGLPVLTTQYNGASELLTVPNNGLVIDDPNDASALGNAIHRFLDPEYRQLAAISAREAAARWTFEHHYRALVNVFAEVQQAKQAA